MKFGNLKALRESLGMTQEAFASTLGLSKTTYNNYETGARDPKSSFWKFVSSKYGVSIDYLLGLVNEPSPRDGSAAVTACNTLTPPEHAHIEKYRRLNNQNRNTVDLTIDCMLTTQEESRESVVILKTSPPKSNDAKFATEIVPDNISRFPIPRQSFAGGIGMDIDDDDADEIEVYVDNDTRKADFIIKVSGVSMEPDFPDGCLAAVRCQETLRVGDIGAVIIDGEPLIKRLGEGCFESINPEYDPIPLNEYTEVTIRGKVLGVVQEA